MPTPVLNVLVRSGPGLNLRVHWTTVVLAYNIYSLELNMKKAIKYSEFVFLLFFLKLDMRSHDFGQSKFQPKKALDPTSISKPSLLHFHNDQIIQRKKFSFNLKQLTHLISMRLRVFNLSSLFFAN